MPNACHETIEIPESLEWFDGHFPGDPVLPGVVLLKWAIERARRFPGVAQPCAVHQLKFKAPIRPGTRVELALKRMDDGDAVEFRFWSEHGEHSSGLLIYV